MDEATIPTWNLRPSLGFQPDPRVGSDVRPGLSFDFGNFKLSASCVLNLRFVEVVLFSGILATRDTLAEIEFELPRQVKSRGQCAAWIVWNLDQHCDHGLFTPARPVRWLDEGRQNRRLLPWVMSMAEYDARPRCMIRRDWLRLALKTLGEQIASEPDDAAIVFTFDGNVLSIRCDHKVIALPGEGLPWTVCFRVEAKMLRQQPRRRLMREYVGVSIWKSRIELGPWSYEGAVGSLGRGSFAEVQ
jgi:hypothetical protein